MRYAGSARGVTVFERAAWPRVLPFTLYMAFIVLGDFLARAGVDALQLKWLYAVKIAAVVMALWWYRRAYAELAWSRLTPWWWGLALGAGLLVLVLWLNLSAGWMVVGTPAGFDPSDGQRLDWALVAVRLAGAALVVPVMEELFWRSFLLRWLVSPRFLQVDPGKADWRALAISSVLFGIEHSLWLAGVVAGVVYALLYRRSKNLWTAVLAHGVTNGVLGVWIITTKSWTYW